MTAQNDHSNSGTQGADDERRVVRSDSESRAAACEFLTGLIGSPPDDLLWDETHHLQGHGHLNGRELVVIAPRDDRHQTIVLTAEDWDAVSRANADQRRDLIKSCAILTHKRLVDVLRGQKRRRGGSFTFAA
jgi:hypothetical protein